jgi:hypothetical protein
MRLTLLSSTPAVETLIAAAMLTTTSGAAPSTLYHRLLEDPGKVRDVVGRLEVQHGSILEHNRLSWLLEAGEDEVLRALLANRFFSFTRLGSRRWLMSTDLRAVLEYADDGGEMGNALIDSLRGVIPTIFGHRRSTA